MPRKHIGFLLVVAVVSATIAVITWPRPAAAQCGSAVSSCKDCHEVKKQAPVNAKGVWHTAHAFGDFCEFCHSGNVKAKDKAAAHTGMTGPLADVKGSCQSCHPNDYMARAQKYSETLGKPIGSNGATAATASTGGSPASNGEGGNCGPAAPTGGQVIDQNKVYASTGGTSSSNLGNVILVGMIAAVLLLLAGLALYYEHPIQRGAMAFRQLVAAPVLAAPEGVARDVPPGLAPRPEISALLSSLSSSDPQAVRAVTQLLSDRENGPRVLKALSNLDLRALTELGESDQKALGALLALAREMRE